MVATTEEGGGKARQRFDRMTVGEIMEKQVRLAHGETKADAVALIMLEGFGSVPIVDEQHRLIGVLSEHDLLASLDRGQRWSEVAAEEIMSRNPYSVRMETTLGTLVHVLKASDLVRVPVVDAQNKLVGIVARRDVLRACLAAGGSANA